MDTAAQWPQDIVTYPKQPSVERKAASRPHKEQVFNCPRCNSTNTKFCYYNNYSLSQPRYFCKTCRRYWTEGGSLRNIPVGGGSRKNKRSSSSSSSLSPNSSSSTRNNAITPSKKLPDLVIPQQQQQNPNHNKIQIIENNQDLNLGFSILSHHNDLKAINEMIRVPNFDKDLMQNPSSSSSLELLNNNGFATTATSASSSRGLMSSFMSIFPPVVSTDNASSNVTDPISTVYSSSSGFSSLMMPEFKSSDLNFSIDGLGSNYESFQGVQEQINGKLLFPFEDLKNQDSSNENDARREESRSDHHQQQHGDHANGNYWNGVIGGGSW